jgi:hypothetical protein
MYLYRLRSAKQTLLSERQIPPGGPAQRGNGWSGPECVLARKAMSALGHWRTFPGLAAMSALPPKADINDGRLSYSP